MDKVNPDNIKIYNKYLRSRKVKNTDVKDTTYKVYQSYMNIFMCYIMERWDNFYLLDEEVLEEDMLDIMESFMLFLQDECGNGKKVINTKLSAVSSFYHWATKRRLIKAHPFAGRLERIQNAQEEKKIAVHFLTQEQIDKITEELSKPKDSLNRYDWQDEILWRIAYDSAARIGAIHQLSLSNLDLDKRQFTNIREKRSKIVNVPFLKATQERLREYLQWREENGINCDALFFARKNGEWTRMSKQSLTLRIRKIGEIIGIGDFRPHSIRKSRLNIIGKKNIKKAASLAHHESIDTTVRFYTEKEDETATLDSIEEELANNE